MYNIKGKKVNTLVTSPIRQGSDVIANLVGITNTPYRKQCTRAKQISSKHLSLLKKIRDKILNKDNKLLIYRCLYSKLVKT